MSAFATGKWQGYAWEGEVAAARRARCAARPAWLACFTALPPETARGPARRGAIPERPLRLAEYLFYRGRVGWEDVLAALRWQRGHRPVVGQIAVSWGWLRRDDVRHLLARRCRERAFCVPFCEFAQRLGFISEAQRTALLGRQERLQRRIGEYFVGTGLLSSADVEALAHDLRRHNARCRAREDAAAAAPARPPKGGSGTTR